MKLNTIKVKELTGNHKVYFLPSQFLKGKPFDSCEFNDGSNKIKVLNRFCISRNDPYPESLFWITVGRDVDWEAIKREYNASDNFFIIIAEGI